MIRSKTFVSNKKGLFAVAVGEGNISSDFALRFDNARSSINGEVSKRRGQTHFNSVAFPGVPDQGGPNILTLALYEGDFVNDYEVLAYAKTELRRYSSVTGAFDTLVKSGLTAETRLCPAAFNGKLVFSNGIDTPFKYGYLPKPSQPTTGTAVSGALALRTYYVKLTYVSANGEGVASVEKSQSVAANSVLTVTKPTALPGATSYNVYVSTSSGGETKQNASPVAIASNWQEPDTGLVSNLGAPPSTNTAWYVADLADGPPKGKYLAAVNHRLWVGGIRDEDAKLYYCAVDDEDDWTTANDAGSIDLSTVITKGDKIRGLARLGQTNELIIGLRSHVIVYSVPTTATDIALSQVIYNVGVMSHYAMTEMGNDTFVVSNDGVNSLRRDLLLQSLRTKTATRNIKDEFNADVFASNDKEGINATLWPRENEYWVSIPSVPGVWVYNTLLDSWSKDGDKYVFSQVVTPDGYLLSGSGQGHVFREYKNASGVDVYGDYNNSEDVAFRWDTPWLWLDDVNRKKIFKYFQFKGTGEGQFELDVYFDFSDTPYTTLYLQSKPSLFDDVNFDAAYFDFPDINKVLIPLIGRGKAVKFSFRADHKNSMTISFYGIQYVMSGLRGND